MSNQKQGPIYSCLSFVRTFLAQPCAICGGRSLGSPICGACHDTLPHLSAPRCPVCAQPTPLGEVCGACLKHPPAFVHTVAAFRYAAPLDSLVQRFKYGGELALAGFFADSLAAMLKDHPPPDLLIPLPLHPDRTRERGFNQAVEIAKPLARRLNLPLDYLACRRVRATSPQAGLPLKERRRNIRGAFACDGRLAGKRVALLDDVMTSGASLDELAKAARRAGAAEVSVWVVARAVKDDRDRVALDRQADQASSAMS